MQWARHGWPTLTSLMRERKASVQSSLETNWGPGARLLGGVVVASQSDPRAVRGPWGILGPVMRSGLGVCVRSGGLVSVHRCTVSVSGMLVGHDSICISFERLWVVVSVRIACMREIRPCSHFGGRQHF